MGTGYTRNDAANNIADGNIINASDLDGEFDAVEAAFNSTTGHTHDGTSAEGAPIEVIGPTQDVVITASVMRPKTTNTVDLGTSSLEFKDAYFDGTITTDALTVTAGITSDTVTISSDNAGAAKGPQLDIFRDSASPADSDVLGHIDFSGKDDGDNKTIYASILAEAADVTDTTEDGVLKFNTMVDGSDTTTMTITESKVGIGSSPSQTLHVFGPTASSGDARSNVIITDDTSFAEGVGGGIVFRAKYNTAGNVTNMASIQGIKENATDGNFAGALVFTSRANGSANSEAMRIDSSGRVLIGTSSSRRTSGGERQFQIEGTTGVTSSMSITRNTNSTTAPSITLAKTRGTSVGDNTIVIDGDNVGQIVFAAADGTDADSRVAEIEAFIDGTPGANDTPGSLVFSTTADGAASTTERMRIDSSGNVGIGISSSIPTTFTVRKSNASKSWTTTGDRIAEFESNGTAAINIVSGIGNSVISFSDAADENIGQIQYIHSTDSMQFRTNDATAMIIDDSGSLGIGTSTPSTTLDVHSAGASLAGLTSHMEISHDSLSADTGGALVLSSNNNRHGGIKGGSDSGGGTGYLSFYTRPSSGDLSERMRIDSSGNVGIGVTPEAWTSAFPAVLQVGAGMALTTSGGDNARILGNVYYDGSYKRITSGFAHQYEQTGGTHRWYYAATGAADSAISFSEAMRIDSSGNLLVGKTSASSAFAGAMLYNSGGVFGTVDGNYCARFNRLTSDGDIIDFQKDGTTVGSIGSTSTGGIYIQSKANDASGPLVQIRDDGGTTNLVLGATATSYGYIGDTSGSNVGAGFVSNRVQPTNASTGAGADNTFDLGVGSARWDDIFATNSTINTSDEREKQQIASLTSAEITAATAISKLFKTYKWNDKVEAKGDAARTHTGVVAQQVETAMSDAGLDASKYAFWCSDTWWQVDGGEAYDTQEEAPEGATERNRKGIRYPELLAFIGAATEQRLTSIEARLDALET